MKVIKIDRKNNYFVDSFTKEIILKYDSKKDIKLVCSPDDIGGRSFIIDSEMFKTSKSGLPSFVYDGEEYIIDDGYNTELIRAGYIVKDKYDSVRTPKDEFDKALEERKNNFSKMKELVEKYIGSDENGVYLDGSSKLKWSIYKYGYRYTFIIDVVDRIVGYNQQRKELSLPFYPFLKEMDKFRTVYVRAFCQKVSENDDFDHKYETAEEYINALLDILNNEAGEPTYKFTKMIVKRKINLLDFEG